MQKEYYGLTKSEYRNRIESPDYTARMIMDDITLPKSVYKFRCFGGIKDGRWQECSYWKESMDGVFYYSKPSAFNKNDAEDCAVRFNTEKVLDYMGRPSNRREKRFLKKSLSKDFDDYKNSLQSKMFVGHWCLTPMWSTSRQLKKNL